MAKKERLSRKLLVEKIVEFVNENGLNHLYAGGVSELKTSNGGVICYNIPFCQTRYIDGNIHVASYDKITINWQTLYRTLPHEDRITLNSGNVLEFLEDAFIKRLNYEDCRGVKEA